MSKQPARPILHLNSGQTHQGAVAAEAPVEDEVVEKRRVRLVDTFGFINEYDARYLKIAGTIITNPLEIAALEARGAPLEDV